MTTTATAHIWVLGHLMSKEETNIPLPTSTSSTSSNRASSERAESEDASLAGGGPATAQFPVQLQRMLNAVEDQGLQRIVGWHNNGAGFVVHNKQQFENQIMPMYFPRLKYVSFKRRLHLFGFRSDSKQDKRAFRHPSFARWIPEQQLLDNIKASERKPKASSAKAAAAADFPGLQPPEPPTKKPPPSASTSAASAAGTGTISFIDETNREGAGQLQGRLLLERDLPSLGAAAEPRPFQDPTAATGRAQQAAPALLPTLQGYPPQPLLAQQDPTLRQATIQQLMSQTRGTSAGAGVGAAASGQDHLAMANILHHQGRHELEPQSEPTARRRQSSSLQQQDLFQQARMSQLLQAGGGLQNMLPPELPRPQPQRQQGAGMQEQKQSADQEFGGAWERQYAQLFPRQYQQQPQQQQQQQQGQFPLSNTGIIPPQQQPQSLLAGSGLGRTEEKCESSTDTTNWDVLLEPRPFAPGDDGTGRGRRRTSSSTAESLGNISGAGGESKSASRDDRHGSNVNKNWKRTGQR